MTGDDHPHLTQVLSDCAQSHRDGQQPEAKPKELELRQPGFGDVCRTACVDKGAANFGLLGAGGQHPLATPIVPKGGGPKGTNILNTINVEFNSALDSVPDVSIIRDTVEKAVDMANQKMLDDSLGSILGG